MRTIPIRGRIFFLLPLTIAVTIAATVLFVLGYSMVFSWCEHWAKHSAATMPWLHALLAAACFALGAWMCQRYASHAAGNGVPKIILALNRLDNNKEDVRPYLGFRLIGIKTVASWLCAFGGGALGREGPVVHLSAALFWVFGRHIKRWFPKLDLRHWIIAGSASGFAVAFNAPLAGIVFVAEELGDRSLSRNKHMTLWVVLAACLAQSLLFKASPLFPVTLGVSPWNQMIIPLILNALLCGLLAAGLMHAARLAEKHIAGRYPFWQISLGCGALVGIIGAMVGGQSFGGGILTTQLALEANHQVLSVVDVLARLVNTFLSAFSGNAGGLLAPSLALGAGIGNVIADLLTQSDPRILMTCGMVAFLAGLLNIPLTAAILVLETTGQFYLVIPYFFSAMLGNVSSRYTGRLLHYRAESRQSASA
ncbi:MAG: chloride channel protein [Holosporaceae bacterium]|jgi:H+/Cl- antiporter ClcA